MRSLIRGSLIAAPKGNVTNGHTFGQKTLERTETKVSKALPGHLFESDERGWEMNPLLTELTSEP